MQHTTHRQELRRLPTMDWGNHYCSPEQMTNILKGGHAHGVDETSEHQPWGVGKVTKFVWDPEQLFQVFNRIAPSKLFDTTSLSSRISKDSNKTTSISRIIAFIQLNTLLNISSKRLKLLDKEVNKTQGIPFFRLTRSLKHILMNQIHNVCIYSNI